MSDRRFVQLPSYALGLRELLDRRVPALGLFHRKPLVAGGEKPLAMQLLLARSLILGSNGAGKRVYREI